MRAQTVFDMHRLHHFFFFLQRTFLLATIPHFIYIYYRAHFSLTSLTQPITKSALKHSVMATYLPPGLLRPIPTSLVRGDFLGTPTPVPYYPPLCLDEVVNDAFLQAIGVLKDASKIEKVELFRRFIEGIHCQENLEFLVAIYTYDYYYEKLVPEATKQMKGSETLSKQILLHSTTTSTGFMPGFDDDDIDFVHQSPENLPASLDVSEDPYEMEVTHVQFLNNMWRDILSTFILDDAAKQINLSASHYDEVLEHLVGNLVHPAVLATARQEVWQILKENVWPEYLKLTLPSLPPFQLQTVTLLVLLAQTLTPKSRKPVTPDVMLILLLLLLWSQIRRLLLLPLLKNNSRLTLPLSVDNNSSFRFWRRKN